MNEKITLELPVLLFQQVKAASLHRRITMEQFICEALQEKLARMSQINTAQHQTVIPPPPKIPPKELKAIHKKIFDAATKIHPGDWK